VTAGGGVVRQPLDDGTATPASTESPRPAHLATGVKPRRKVLDRLGVYEAVEPPVESTTAQAAALRLALVTRAGSERALFEGVDAYTGEPAFTDPVSDYAMPDGPRSPTRLTVGAVGVGKSAAIKTTAVLRPLLLGRRVALVDRKLQGHTHEYAPLCDALQVAPVRLATDGTGVKINVLDRLISTTGGAAGVGAGQTHLLRAILDEGLGRPLTPKEGKALRVAHRAAITTATDQHRVADIRDLLPPLLRPDSTAADAAGVSVGELREWGLDAAFTLERMIEEDLAGLIDGPTDPAIALNRSLTVFDISALPDEGPAVPIVMAIISSWLGYTLRAQGTVRVPTHFVIEEGWHLTRGSFGLVAQRNSKLARGAGMVPEYVLHHLSDIPDGSPAMAMCKEAGTVRMFGQDTAEDADACVRTYSLPADAAGELQRLPVGSYLYWQSGRPPRVLTALRSELEKSITNTDEVLLSRKTMYDLLDHLDTEEHASDAPVEPDVDSQPHRQPETAGVAP
jgi:hypothetical protein